MSGFRASDSIAQIRDRAHGDGRHREHAEADGAEHHRVPVATARQQHQHAIVLERRRGSRSIERHQQCGESTRRDVQLLVAPRDGVAGIALELASVSGMRGSRGSEEGERSYVATDRRAGLAGWRAACASKMSHTKL